MKIFFKKVCFLRQYLKSLDRLRGYPLFMSANFRAGAVSRTEDASGAAGGCPQSVESAVLRAFEDAFNVAGCRFCAFENAFGGAGGCLAHL